MVVEYIRYKIEKSKHNAFIDAYRKASEFLDKSAYCLGYELTHCEEEEENFILRITWTSTEDYVDFNRRTFK